MTSREKNLAIVAGLMLVALVGYFGWSSFDGAMRSRRATIANLEGEIDRKKLAAEQGRLANVRLAAYHVRSLPADRALARSLYQHWLLDLAGKVELRDVAVSANAEGALGDHFHRLSFNLAGKGDLRQVTQLLYGFYEVNQLHQIRRLQIKPIKDSRDLEVSLGIEALRLDKADQAALCKDPNPLIAGRSLDDFAAKILGRNLFAPPNHPPGIASLSGQRINLGSPVSITVKATDPDPLDKVHYALGDDAPSGAQIDAASGRFRWTPDQLGEFQVEVLAHDDGFPQRTARKMVYVAVVEPPPPTVATNREPARPPKLKFDIAKHTYLIGTIESDGRREVWLQVRTTGKVHKLSEGDDVTFGSIDGVIARIGDRDLEIATEDARLLIGVGENLSEAATLPPGDI